MIDVSPELGADLLAAVVTERIEDTARRLLVEDPSRTLTLRALISLVSAEVVELAHDQGMDDEFCNGLTAIVVDCARTWFARASASYN